MAREFVMGARMDLDDQFSQPLSEMSKNTNEFRESIDDADNSVRGMDTGSNMGMLGRAIDNAREKVERLNQSFLRAGESMRKTGRRMTMGITLPLATAGGFMLKTAGDAEEMQAKFDTVFRGMEGSMEDWAATQSDTWGRSQLDLQNFLADTQNMLVGMGMVREEGAEMSKAMVSLGIDLASFNNVAEADAMRSIQSAMLGEHQAAKALGAVLNEGTLALAMQEEGLKGNFQALTETEKMQARYRAIVMQSEDAMGDAARTSESFTNQSRRLMGEIKDTAAAFGKHLIPYATIAAKALGDLVGWFGTLDESTTKAALIMGFVVAAIGPVIFALGLMATMIGTIGVPVAAAIAGVALFAGGLVAAYQASDEFRNRVNRVFAWLQDVFGEIVKAVKQAIPVIIDWFKELQVVMGPIVDEAITGVITAFDWLAERIPPILQTVKGYITQGWEFLQTEIIPMLWDYYSTVVSSFMQMGEAIIPVLKSLWAFLQDGWVMLQRLLAAVMPVIQDIIVEVWHTITEHILPILKSLWGLIVSTFQLVATLLVPILMFIWGIIKDVFDLILTHVWPVMTDIFRIIIDTWHRIWATLGPLLTDIIGGITVIFNELKSFFEMYWPLIYGYFTLVWGIIRGVITAALQVILPLIKNVFNIIMAVVRNVWTMIAGIIKVAWSLIQGIIVTALRLLQGDWSGAWDAMLEMLDGVWDGIKTFFEGLGTLFWEAGKALIETLADGIKSVAMAPLNAVKGAFDAVTNLFPSSDAKEGPFDHLTKNGASILSTMAQGIKGSTGGLHDAMETAFSSLPAVPEMATRLNVTTAFDNKDVPEFDTAAGIRPGQVSNPSGVSNAGNQAKTITISSLVEQLNINGADGRSAAELAEEIIEHLYEILTGADDILSGADRGALL